MDTAVATLFSIAESTELYPAVPAECRCGISGRTCSKRDCGVMVELLLVVQLVMGNFER